jgi:hypothetical protein
MPPIANVVTTKNMKIETEKYFNFATIGSFWIFTFLYKNIHKYIQRKNSIKTCQ